MRAFSSLRSAAKAPHHQPVNKEARCQLHSHLPAPSSGPWGGGTAGCPPGRAWGLRTPPACPEAAGGCRRAASGRGTAVLPAHGSSASRRWKMHKSVMARSAMVTQEIKPRCACYWDQLRPDVESVVERRVFLTA